MTMRRNAELADKALIELLKEGPLDQRLREAMIYVCIWEDERVWSNDDETRPYLHQCLNESLPLLERVEAVRQLITATLRDFGYECRSMIH
jgi:hypothetical protein